MYKTEPAQWVYNTKFDQPQISEEFLVSEEQLASFRDKLVVLVHGE